MPHEPPEHLRENYDRYLVNGLEVYIQQGTVMTGPAVMIGLAGFWKFRWLTVAGVGSISACTI